MVKKCITIEKRVALDLYDLKPKLDSAKPNDNKDILMRQAERQRVLDEVESYFDERHPDLVPGTIKVYLAAIRVLMEAYGVTRSERGQWIDAMAQMNREGKSSGTKGIIGYTSDTSPSLNYS